MSSNERLRDLGHPVSFSVDSRRYRGKSVRISSLPSPDGTSRPFIKKLVVNSLRGTIGAINSWASSKSGLWVIPCNGGDGINDALIHRQIRPRHAFGFNPLPPRAVTEP
jgi:hypothetical protein